MPKRIQRKRTKGWRKPEDAIYIGRPSKWGNPYSEGQKFEWLPFLRLAAAGIVKHGDPLPSPATELTRPQAIDMYRVYIFECTMKNPHYFDIEQLRGKDLMCWCPLDQPCHADVLLEIANA